MTTELKNIAAQIDTLKAEYDESLIWGVRFDAAGLEIGHVFDASRVWDDGEAADDLLNGTSVVQDTHVVRVGANYLNLGTPYIVCGYMAGYGEDRGEVILTECEVMEVVK